MAKNNFKERKKTEIKENVEDHKQEESVKEEQTGEQKETEGSHKSGISETSNTTKIAIVALIIVILILTVFLVFALKKKSPDKSPINIVPEQADNLQTNKLNQSDSDTNTAPENTDSLLSATELSAATPEVKKADLYISEYYFSEDPKMGKEFTVKIKIGNKGKAMAKNFHWEWWPTAYDKACEGEIDVLAIGEIKKVECTYTYGSWSTYVTKAVVDTKYEVDESDESNNSVSKEVIPIHEESKADLYITNYAFNHPPKQGEAFTVSITIKNKGDTDADSFWWEWWPTAYGKFCREKIDGLDAGDDKTVSCTYTYGGWANYATKAVADADNDVSESDETNNTYSQTVMPIH
jgi:subtilase family serine protease